MKKKFVWTLALAVFLFTMMWASRSVALTACEKLGAKAFGYLWSGPQGQYDFYPLKPTSAFVCYTWHEICWGIPHSRPLSTVTGSCMHLRHVSSGRTREFCLPFTQGTSYDIAKTGCLGGPFGGILGANCPKGDYSVKIKMQNNCGLKEEWTSPVITRKE